MKILDRLPIPDAETLAFAGAETVRLKKAQIIVWVSLRPEREVQWSPATRRFPAILDTGHSHNFAIRREHLIRWAGMLPESMRLLGHVRHSGQRMPLHAVNLWLHRNEAGKATIAENPFRLLVPRGITLHKDEGEYPRLPLLGLRALLSNHLHLTIDGAHASVTMRTPDWRTRVLGWMV